jgi:hypothetical protein
VRGEEAIGRVKVKALEAGVRDAAAAQSKVRPISAG